MKNMEQDEVLHHLNDQNSIKKLETLKQLQLTVKRNGGRLPWEDPWTIFKGLDGALLDTAWEVRLKCLHLIIDLIPRFGANLDSCMFLILKNLVPALGDHKVQVRRSSIQAMHLYLTYTEKFEELSKAIALYGLENGSESIQRECVLALPIILTKDLSDRNFFPLVQSLTKKVYEGYNENVQELALLALKKLCDLVGSAEFNNYLQRLPEEVRMAYLREISPEVKELYSDLNDSQEFPATQTNFQKIGLSSYHQFQQMHEYHPPHLHNPSHNEGLLDVHMSGNLEFGVFPQQLIVQIKRVEDGYKLRAPAVESLQTILSSLSKHEISRNMGSHMLSFIDFLDNLLDDPNFKITTIALEILCILVEKLQQDVQLFLKPLVLTLARRLSNNKIVIRQGVMRVTMKLMYNASPKLVLCVMLENLRHKASRVRQEMINIVIAALLVFPSDEFDLCSLCKEIVPLLIDSKRNVRRAALECVAVIAQAMGQGRYQPLIQVVDYTEISQKSVKGLMTAVQARLARRHLPHIGEDGLVEYAMSAPSSATQRKISGSTQNADVDWILAASGGSSSARYESTEDSTSLNESIQVSISDDRHKRFLSAGKGKNKLPWDGDEDMQQHKVYDDLPGSAPAQKVTSNKPATLLLTGTDTEKFKPKKSTFLVGPKDEGNDPGSYKQIYRNDKLKREHAYPSLSNSDANSKDSKENATVLWSTCKNPDDITKPMRTKLFPLSGKELDNSPIPMKPALARGSASGRSGSSSSNSSRSETHYISPPSESIDSSSYSPFGNYSDEMSSSLKNIRDSASKRRAEKLEKSNFGGDSLRSSAQSVLSSDSGHYSISAFQDKQEEMKRHDGFHSKVPVESPFGTKPNLVRSNSLRTKRPQDLMYDTKRVNQWTEYSSSGGISQSQTSEVCVFGKGYLEESTGDGRIAATKIKHQKRHSKDISAGTPLGTASLYAHGSIEMRSGDNTPGQDMIGVIGKGLNLADNNSNNQSTPSPTECFNTKSDIGDITDGVHGLGISNCFKDKQNLSENNSDVTTIDDDFMQISKTTRDRMSIRRRKGDKPKQTDNKFQLEVLLATTNCPATEKPGKPPVGPRIKPKLLHSDNSQLTVNSSSDLNNNPENLASIPAGGLEELQRKLIQDDWKIKCEALNLVRQLAKFHPNIFDSGFHPLLLAVTRELDNLRSQVKRDAILCVTDMFLYLKRRMDTELDQTIGCLLALMAVSKEFIRTDVEKAFDVMIDNVTCSKALPILISKGLKHRSVGIRKTASYYVLAIAKKIGHRRLLSGAKDLTDRILQATVDCIIDASNEVRYHGKEILYLLLENPNLDQLLEKYLPAESLATMRTQMELLSKKGLMEMSYESSSAPPSAKSLPSSRGGSAGSLLNAQISPKRPVSLKNIESVQGEIKKMGNLLSANDWRTRQKGLETFKEMCEISPGIVTANITQVFDKFLPRLQDANSKVNLLALRILYDVIPVLHGSMGPVVNLTVNCVATNLSSKNIEIHSTAVKIIDSLMAYLEPSVLLRPFANQVTTNARRCPEIIPKITELVEREYKFKPKQIEMHILPLLLHLLNCVNGSGTVQGGSCSLRLATTNLISALVQQMGPSLMEKFSQLVDVTPRHQQYLQDILNHT